MASAAEELDVDGVAVGVVACVGATPVAVGPGGAPNAAPQKPPAAKR